MEKYKIGELAKLTGHSTHTLRYYEKEGLLMNVDRMENGLRSYNEHDLEMVRSIDCLKDTGMSIKEIKKHIDLFACGPSTYAKRVELFKLQKKRIEEKQKELKRQLEVAKYKIWYYENMDELGDEEDPMNCSKMKERYNNLKKK